MSNTLNQLRNAYTAAEAMYNAGVKEVARNSLWGMENSSVAYLTKKLVNEKVAMRRMGESYDQFEYGSSNRSIMINVEDLLIGCMILLSKKSKAA